jgi:tRNA A37 methylthiotransferase MiaB
MRHGHSRGFPGDHRIAFQAACRQVAQVQSEHTHAVHWSPPQLAHEQTLWLQVAQVQSEQVQRAQLSEQLAHEQVAHSS